MTRQVIIAITGHRPGKGVGFDYAGPTAYQLAMFARQVVHTWTTWPEDRQPLVRVGMALGWDMAIAQACVEFGVPYHAYVPFIGQASRWPTRSQDQHRALCEQATEVVLVSSARTFSAKLMHERNEAMVRGARRLRSLRTAFSSTVIGMMLSALDMPISFQNARIDSGVNPRRRRPASVGMRGSSQPLTCPSSTSSRRRRLLMTV